MARKKIVEPPPEEKLIEFEVVSYKEGEEPKEVSQRPSEINHLTSLVSEDPLADMLNKLKEAVGDVVNISSLSKLEVGNTNFIIVKLSRGSFEKIVPTIDEFTKTTEQSSYVGVHPDVISVISNALSKLTKDSVVIDYE